MSYDYYFLGLSSYQTWPGRVSLSPSHSGLASSFSTRKSSSSILDSGKSLLHLPTAPTFCLLLPCRFRRWVSPNLHFSIESRRRGEEGTLAEAEMGDSPGARYWCHMCSQVVSPIMDAELKCPFCDSGFVEEMGSRGDLDAAVDDLGSDRALSLWAPILLGMMGGSRRRRFHREEEDDELDRERGRDAEAVLRRRRRSSALLQLLLGRRTGIDSDAEREREGEGERNRDRDPVVLINLFNQAIIIQGSSDRNDSENPNADALPGASLGDYFIGPGLDLLLQHLTENDPNRYGRPPAKKEAVDALPMVKVEGNLSCSVCLEDFAHGGDATEMPCKHIFHSDCILPWLKLHSSCPVCRFQLPADETKESNGSSSNNRAESASSGTDGGDVGNGRRFWIPVPWPFNGMFSLSGSQNGGNSSSSASGSNPHEDEN